MLREENRNTKAFSRDFNKSNIFQYDEFSNTQDLTDRQFQRSQSNSQPRKNLQYNNLGQRSVVGGLMSTNVENSKST